MIILPKRQELISDFAENVAGRYSDRNVTSLSKIADIEGVPIYHDGYEDAFDGMLCLDDNRFHIHINTDLGNYETSKRGRFTLAHELGHYLLDEHRLGLQYGLLEPHASFHNVVHKSLIEQEADYFAACLLMPHAKFRQHGIKKFSLDTILHLSEYFQVSVLATILRFAEIGTHSIFATVSKNGNAKWFTRSKDFPSWPTKFEIGSKIPSASVAAEFYATESKKYDDPQSLDADDWFRPYDDDNRASKELFEQCYYSDSYGYVLSILWFK